MSPIAPTPAPSVAVYFLGGNRLPGASTHIEGLADIIPGVSDLRRALSQRELLTLVRGASKAVVILCISDKQDLIEVMGLLKTLDAKARPRSLRILVFSVYEMPRINALLTASGCADVLPYSLSRRGLTTKIHYHVRALGAPAVPGTDRWVIHAEPFLASQELPKILEFNDEDYATGESAFASLRMQVLIYPEFDASAQPIEANLLERETNSFVLDVPVSVTGGGGAMLLVDFVCEGELLNRSRVELQIDSVEPSGEGRKLLFTKLINGDARSLQATVSFLGERQDQILRFLEAARGF